MDHGWIVALASEADARRQIGIASGGGACAPVPELSTEVEGVDVVHRRALKRPGHGIVRPLIDEPRGVSSL